MTGVMEIAWLATTVAALLVAIIGGGLAYRFLRQMRVLEAARGRVEADEALWREAIVQQAKGLERLEDPALLLQVLTDLRDQLQAAVELGAPIFGSAELAFVAKASWNDHVAAELDEAIAQVGAGWREMRPQLAAAGPTGTSLQFKALTIAGFLAPARLTVPRVADGERDLFGHVEALVRSGKLLNYFKSADVVWESTVAVLAVVGQAAVGVPPSVGASQNLGKHSVTEFKKMIEAILGRKR